MPDSGVIIGGSRGDCADIPEKARRVTRRGSAWWERRVQTRQVVLLHEHQWTVGVKPQVGSIRRHAARVPWKGDAEAIESVPTASPEMSH